MYKGGNTRLVFYPGSRKAVNLHSVWDTWILRDMIARRRIASVADGMNKMIITKQREEWSKGTPETWANETHRVAVEKVYADVPESGPPPRLGADYPNVKAKIVAEQLERGGVRLATVLNAALK